MTDNVAPTTDPAPTPAPVPAPDPAPAPAPAPAPLKPGYLTTEGWFSFFIVVVGAIPSSGLVDNAPIAAKIVGLVSAALSVINYTIQRTALKRAYLAAIGVVSSQSVKSVKSAKIASVAALVLAVVAIGAVMMSCAGTDCAAPKNAQSAQCVVENAIVDCTGITTLPAAVAVAAPAVDTLIKSGQKPDGSINWPAIETPLINLVLEYGPCVIAQIWNDYMSGSSTVVATGSGSGSGSAVVVARVSRPAAEFAAEWERIRAKVAPGRHFKTRGGTL